MLKEIQRLTISRLKCCHPPASNQSVNPSVAPPLSAFVALPDPLLSNFRLHNPGSRLYA